MKENKEERLERTLRDVCERALTVNVANPRLFGSGGGLQNFFFTDRD